jgi:5'-phosphate synthase pdxT subunit
VLSEVRGHIVAAEEDNVLVTAFHPELTDDLRVHRYFLNKIEAARDRARGA